MRKFIVWTLAGLLLGIWVFGAPSVSRAQEGKKIFNMRCAACHGENGKGDGPYLASDAPIASRMLEPLPAGYLQGRHQPDGIFVAAGPDIRKGAQIEGARIVDVAPTVLYALGLPIPEDMDGRPLLEIFDHDYRATQPVQYAEPELLQDVTPEPVYDEEDTLEMERRLRGLGYVS